MMRVKLALELVIVRNANFPMPCVTNIFFHHQDQACPAITSSMTKIGANRYYHVSPTQMDWEAAKTYCGTISPELILAPMNTPEEYQAAKTIGSSVGRQSKKDIYYHNNVVADGRIIFSPCWIIQSGTLSSLI